MLVRMEQFLQSSCRSSTFLWDLCCKKSETCCKNGHQAEQSTLLAMDAWSQKLGFKLPQVVEDLQGFSFITYYVPSVWVRVEGAAKRFSSDCIADV